MTKRAHPQVLTANALHEGNAVWRAPDGSWTPDISQAEVLHDAGRAALLLAEAEAQWDEVVGPYLAQVYPEPGGPRPVHFREAFRTRGPSNYFHGKQAGD